MTYRKIYAMTKNGCVELKPCPFCGGKNLKILRKTNIKMLNGTDGRQVFCLDCGGTTGIRTHNDAVALWNSRPVVEE